MDKFGSALISQLLVDHTNIDTHTNSTFESPLLNDIDNTKNKDDNNDNNKDNDNVLPFYWRTKCVPHLSSGTTTSSSK